MKISKILLVVAVASLTGACATITGGQKQALSVQTAPITGAQCNLTNDEGTWFVSQTPGSVTINRSYSDLSVTCEKGEHKGATSVKSKTKGMAFGNIIAGGIIGGAVDMGTGAAYDYPTLITVEMKKGSDQKTVLAKNPSKTE